VKNSRRAIELRAGCESAEPILVGVSHGTLYPLQGFAFFAYFNAIAAQFPMRKGVRPLRSDLIDPTIAVHHGRIVKRTGDGALVEFRSVVEAVRCAIEVRSSMVERNAGLPPDRRIDFRIGIHLGDIVEESDGDLMGDGVNIAAQVTVSRMLQRIGRDDREGQQQ
jgi:hypothetical protein